MKPKKSKEAKCPWCGKVVKYNMRTDRLMPHFQSARVRCYGVGLATRATVEQLNGIGG